MSHGFTTNHTPYMLSCHHWFLIDLENGISTSWGSDPVRSIQVSIWYLTVVGVLDGILTMSDSWVISHESQFCLQTQPRHALLSSSWFPSIIAWKMVSLPVEEVIQWGPCRSRYAIPLLSESWIMHGPCKTGMEHAMSHGFTFCHTPRILYQVMNWSNEVHTGLNILTHCCRSIGWYTNYV